LKKISAIVILILGIMLCFIPFTNNTVELQGTKDETLIYAKAKRTDIEVKTLEKQPPLIFTGWTTANLNIRKKPSLSSEIYDVLPAGTEITYYEYNNKWGCIKYDYERPDIEMIEIITAYVSLDYITKNQAEAEYRALMSRKNVGDKKEWFLEYKEFINKHSDSPETIQDYFTEEELEILYGVVEAEVGGLGGFDERCNVASVIFNRMNDEVFKDTLPELLTAHQFSTIGNGAYQRVEPTEDTILACAYAFEIGDTTDGALYFHSNSKTNTFNGARYLFTDNASHHFYK